MVEAPAPGDGGRPVPEPRVLRWLIALRLVVITTLFVGSMIVQVTSRMILPLQGLYVLTLVTYVLSLLYTVLYLARVSTRLQAAVQIFGDVAIVTGFVYVTGGLYSPFSFLYLPVIAVAALILPRGGLLAAGLSSIAYGSMVDLMVFEIVPIPPNLVGRHLALPPSRVLVQLFINIVGFLVVALLVAYLSESVHRMASHLEIERRRSQRAEALADHVLRSISAGMMALDSRGTILQANPAAAKILGVGSPESLQGRPVEEVFPLGQTRWGLLLSRARFRAVSRLEDHLEPSGEELGLTVGPLTDEHGAQAGFVISFQTLSEVRRAAERRRQQERMAALGEMAARMAHEIRNPLASISGAAQVLATEEGSGGKSRRLLDIVVRESRRLSQVLQDFLQFARPGAEAKRDVRISSLVEECLALLKTSPDFREDHRVEVRIPPDLTLPADENLLRQVVWNLARNALQAMPQGGSLLVEAQVEAGGDWVTLRFTDTGEGVPEEILARAFEPFVTGRPDGTGLGLAVVYAAVTEHGGSVEIEPGNHAGTQVVVRLPRAVREAE